VVEVKYESHYSCNNISLAHQEHRVYYLSYLHQSFKNWWEVYKFNLEIHTHRYNRYMKGQEEEDVVDVHQEDPIEHQNFMVSGGPGLTEFATL
jgi:hypothetical protein